jgi:hypothetical protein
MRMIEISAKFDKSGLASIEPGAFKRAMLRALRKAGATALRDMRSEASKRIRARKRISSKYITRAIKMRRAGGSDVSAMSWALELSGDPVPLIAYPHQVTPEGVSVEVNRGKRTLLRHSFAATMRSGHEGIFRRRGPERLPIEELLGSRPVDALLHEGEAPAVAERGAGSLAATFARLLPLELGKK